MTKVFRDDRARAEFLFQLGSLLDGGYPLGEAAALYERFSQGKQKEWLTNAVSHLNTGGMMADSLQEAGFPKELVSSLRFAEMYGDLQNGFLRSASILRKRAEMKEQIKSVLHYPAFLLVGFIAIIGVMVQGVIPRFDVFFDSMGHQLPWITQFVLKAFQFTYVSLLAGIVFCVLAVIFSFRRKTAVEQWKTLLKIPFAKNYFRSFLTYYFLAQLSPLLINGFSLRDSIKTIEEEALHELYRNEGARITASLREGEPFAEAIAAAPYYVDQLTEIVEIGESKGRLGEELERFSAYLFSHIYSQTYERLRWFQPVFFAIIGGVVLMLFLSMMMPVFTMIDGI
ncbi:competence-related pilin export protein ComGB [Salisediminibacterium halotolerans]|nr:competence-related pilin export protein ComGB [Actinophytocola xinjiangensis]RPE88565.1 competence-related pilin export protein ComGB [Salisediminibacterium halotolerans]TWG37074.1 competence-related pilin export protein ComGB [Salisediminibacterium halotolerans]GEL06929.1 type II secretion system protein GspF [Salisediminibacterium halotolerans]